jgi:hypothetical protein
MSKAVHRLEKILASLDDVGYIAENCDLPVTSAIEDKIAVLFEIIDKIR